MTEETKDKIRAARAKQTVSRSTIEKMHAARRGSKNSPEHVEASRQAQLGNKHWLGRKHSEETKKKMSESAKRARARRLAT